MIRHDERRGLQPMDQRVRLREPPIGIRGGLVPHPVEPDASHGPIVREQLCQLRVEKIEIAVPIAAFRTSRFVTGRAPGPIVGVVPIELGVIEEELDALPLAFVRQLF